MPDYKIYHFKSLTSTQDKAKEFSRKGLKDAVVVADIQKKGKGRFARKWHSAKGGLWMSILLKPKSTKNSQYLTFAASIAVVKAIKKLANLSTNIKWPNDIHYKGKKLCGILTEGIFGRENYVIVGIGLNVNQLKFPDELEATATSLRAIRHRIFNIKRLMTNIANQFYHLYNANYQKNKFEKIEKTWKQHCDTLKRDVRVVTKAKTLQGKAINIDKEGSLLLKFKNNKIIKIVEGDVKVRY